MRICIPVLVISLAASFIPAAHGAVAPDVAAAIRAGNAAWVRGMETGNARLAASAYANDVVFCGVQGPCVYGSAAIENLTAESLQRNGPAKAAEVISKHIERDANLAYESGYVSVTQQDGHIDGARYLTVWQQQRDDHWNIFRNLVLPAAR